MLGVDVVDQLIASYQSKLWCQCTWMPIFLHYLDILRVNLYVLCKETQQYNHDDVDNDTIQKHKQHFLIEFINSLIRRGNAKTRSGPIVTQEKANAPCKDPTIVHKGTTGKLVMSRKNPSLSIFENLQYCPGVHELVPARKQSKCKYL